MDGSTTSLTKVTALRQALQSKSAGQGVCVFLQFSIQNGMFSPGCIYICLYYLLRILKGVIRKPTYLYASVVAICMV
jgi:hypothetical protein